MIRKSQTLPDTFFSQQRDHSACNTAYTTDSTCWTKGSICVLIRNFSAANTMANWQQLCCDRHGMDAVPIFPFCFTYVTSFSCVSISFFPLMRRSPLFNQHGIRIWNLHSSRLCPKCLLGSRLQEINKINRAALFPLSVVCWTTCDFWMMDLPNKMVSRLSVQRGNWQNKKAQHGLCWQMHCLYCQNSVLLTGTPHSLHKICLTCQYTPLVQSFLEIIGWLKCFLQCSET